MKLRISDRVLVAVAGILLLACCAGIVAQVFFNTNLTELAEKAFSSDKPEIRMILIGAAVILLFLGIYCVMVLFRHRKRRDKFIVQKNEGGELAISVKALENMVQKCIDQHQELKMQGIYLENQKDGLLIRLRGTVAGGVSIPLTVEALQRQIRQYVTACSGVEIKGIRVQIDASGEDAADAPFAIAAPSAKPLLKEAEEKANPIQPSPQQEEPQEKMKKDAITETEKAETAPPAIPMDEDDDRPLHQRLFSTRPEPCIVPEPPEDASKAVSDEKETAEISAETETEEEGTEEEPLKDCSTDTEEENLAQESDSAFTESLKVFDQIVSGKNEESELK